MTVTIDKDLTALQCRVYEAVRQCWPLYGQAPSQYELQRACDCSSTSVIKAVNILRRKGYVTAIKFGIRTIKPTDPERELRNAPVDPFEELEEPTVYWKAQ